MKQIINIIAFTLALAFVTSAGSTSYSTDQSDLWWNRNESGWGIQLVHRGSVIFATMFVYDPNGKPIWYTATLNASGLTWTGDLYLTSGPWFGNPAFNPALVGLRKVGTMSWNGQAINTGAVTYSVDGVAVTKNVERQLLVADDFSGSYAGAFHGTVTNCFDSTQNNTNEAFGTYVVTQSGGSLTVIFQGQTAGSFTITGTLTQNGQFGTVIGTYSGSTGEIGTATLGEVNVQVNALTLRFFLQSTNNGCQSTGYIAGMRRR